MGKAKIKVKGVAFNVSDIDESKLLTHAEKRSNFSAYIKRLIQRDLDGAFVKYISKPIQEEQSKIKLNEKFMEELV
jgi:hypothetical protein